MQEEFVKKLPSQDSEGKFDSYTMHGQTKQTGWLYAYDGGQRLACILHAVLPSGAVRYGHLTVPRRVTFVWDTFSAEQDPF